MSKAFLLTLVSVTALQLDVAHGANVLEIASRNGCGKLVNLVKIAGLDKAIESDITLFAPSDAALAAIPADVWKALSANATLLQDVLKFHVVSQLKMAISIKNEELLPTLSGGLKLRTNIYNNGKVITAEGSPVSKPDMKASNGVVHVINKVIYPLPTLNTPLFLTFDKDLNNLGFIAYQAQLINNLTRETQVEPTLADLAILLGRYKETTLSVSSYPEEQGLTLFAPSNEVIEKLPGQEYNNLLMNFTELKSVVSYHVVNGTVFSAGLQDGQKVTTLEGHQLNIGIKSGVVTVNGAKVTVADLSTSNGVIHVIDTLLFPPKPPTTKLYDILIPIIG